MPYLDIITSLGRLECINCGSHTYAKRCGTCEGTSLIPIAPLSRNVRAGAALEDDSPPLARGAAG